MKKEIKVLLLAASVGLLTACVEDDAFNSGYSSSQSASSHGYQVQNHGYSTSQGGSHVSGTYSSDGYTPPSTPRKKHIQATAPSANGFQSSSGVAPEAAPATATGYQTDATDASHAPVENAPVSGYSAQ